MGTNRSTTSDSSSSSPNTSSSPSPPPSPPRHALPSKLRRPALSIKSYPMGKYAEASAKTSSKKRKLESDDEETEQMPLTRSRVVDSLSFRIESRSGAQRERSGADAITSSQAADAEHDIDSSPPYVTIWLDSLRPPRSGPGYRNEYWLTREAVGPSQERQWVEDYDKPESEPAPSKSRQTDSKSAVQREEYGAGTAATEDSATDENDAGSLQSSDSASSDSMSAMQQEGPSADATVIDNFGTDDSDTDTVSSSETASSDSTDWPDFEATSGFPANSAIGRPARVKPKDIFSIPPETRLEIFSHILKEDDPIKLQMKRRGYKQHIIRVGSRRELGVALIDPVIDRFMAPTPTKAAVLSVCKSIYAEAAGVLYGENTFFFESLTVLANFLAHINDSTASLLKHVAVANYTTNTAKEAATQLLKASNLRMLSIPHSEFCHPRYGTGKCRLNAGKIVKDFGKVFGPLKTSYEKQNIKADVLDVIVIDRIHGCEEWHSTKDDDKAEACNQRKQKEMSNAIAKHLGIAESGDVAEDGKLAEASGSIN